MFARILVASDCGFGDATWAGRLASALRASGHAVATVDLSHPDEACGVAQVFCPTLVLCDGSADWADDLPCLKEGLSAFPVFRDGRYEGALCSVPDAPRDQVAIMGAAWPDGEAQARAVAGLEGVAGVFALDGGWSTSFESVHPGGNVAHWLRRAKYCVVFPAGDGKGVTEREIALRIAEGCLVLAPERGEGSDDLAAGMFADALVRFEPGALDQTIAALESDDALVRAGLEAQRSVLHAAGDAANVVQSTLEQLDAKAVGAGLPRVLAEEVPASTVVLYGWSGARNFGDDLLLEIACDRIRAVVPNVRICSIGADPSEIQRCFGLEAAEPRQRDRIVGFLTGARALVFLGGLMFDDPMAETAGIAEFMLDPWIEPSGQAAISLLAASLGVPSVGLGIGAGPLKTPVAQAMVRLQALSGMRYLARDAETADMLVAAGVPAGQVSTGADLVFGAQGYLSACVADSQGAELSELGLTEGGYLIVSLRRWHLNPPGFASTVAHALDEAVKAGCKVLFVPFDADDAGLHAEVRAAMECAEGATSLQERPDEDRLLRLIAGSRGAVAMRLHCSVLHWMFDHPAVGLNYNEKVEAQFRAMGQEQSLLPLGVSPEDLAAAVRKLAEGEPAPMPAEARACRDNLAAQVDAFFDELFGIMDAADPVAVDSLVLYPRHVSAAQVELMSAHQALQAEHAQAEALREEASALKGSTSFKVGNALVKPFSAVKHKK